MHKLLYLPLFLFSVILAACSQQTAVAERSDGLQARPSQLDEVAAAFALDLGGARVYIAPAEIEYSKRFSSPFRRHYREKDYQLDLRERQRLDALLAQAFTEKLLKPRNARQVLEQVEADYTLSISLQRFSLAAPLEPSPWAWRIYTEQSAYAELKGTLYNRDGSAVMHFRDRRDIGENLGSAGPGGRLQRFTNVTFWSDLRVDMRRAFASLDKSLL
ncbi:hypothetical protein ACCI51_06025 [Microbulbifer echini]|uniref:DUF3313 domain-containing protein n=1 Tax=Microbulbifer echini TaxID=1529067 RepID=A0ABV4NM52_9GAMM